METLDWMVLWKMLFHSVSHDASGLHNCQVMMSLILLHNWSPDVRGGSGPLKRRAVWSISCVELTGGLALHTAFNVTAAILGDIAWGEESSKMPKSMARAMQPYPPLPP